MLEDGDEVEVVEAEFKVSLASFTHFCLQRSADVFPSFAFKFGLAVPEWS
jgi:hypothetical protein